MPTQFAYIWKICEFRLLPGTIIILSPLLYLLHIDDISSQILGKYKLFMDNCLLYDGFGNENNQPNHTERKTLSN